MPINYTLEKWALDELELIYGTPAELNKLMAEGKIDAAPVSSIEYIRNQDKYDLIETACISSDGECGSVILFSSKELEKINKIALPLDSAASIEMLKIILKQNDIIYSEHNYNNIKSDIDASLHIGDNALVMNNTIHNYIYAYDLGKLWKDMTGYPAVFGTWVRKKNKYEHLDNIVQEAIETGLSLYLNEIMSNASKNLKLPQKVIEDYLTKKINYNFTERHRQSLEKFKESYRSNNSGDNSPYPGGLSL